MVEQWPFKPLVESSSLSALTEMGKVGRKSHNYRLLLPLGPAEKQVFTLITQYLRVSRLPGSVVQIRTQIKAMYTKIHLLELTIRVLERSPSQLEFP
jgi:hypothetical protein